MPNLNTGKTVKLVPLQLDTLPVPSNPRKDIEAKKENTKGAPAKKTKSKATIEKVSEKLEDHDDILPHEMTNRSHSSASSASSKKSTFQPNFLSKQIAMGVHPLSLNLPENGMTKLSARRQDREKLVNEILYGGTAEGSARPQYTYRPKRSSSHHSQLQVAKNVFGKQITSLHSSKARFCIDALTSGCVETFMLLFDLAHREPVLVDPISETFFKIPVSKLKMIKDLLIQAEQQRRQGEFTLVYDNYKQLADYFESEKDTETALFFHQKAQEIAKSSSDTVLEGIAHENLGKMYERLGDIEKAIKSHEAHLSLADANRNEEQAHSARRHLVSVYILTATNDTISPEDACKYLEKAFRMAKISKEQELIAATMFELGNCYQKLQDFEKAVEYLREYHQMCEEMGDLSGKARAQNALGPLLEQRGLEEVALDTYREFLQNAEKSKDKKGQGAACEKLGMMLMKMNRHEEAVVYFEKNFSIAQQYEPSDKQWISQSKVLLGFARGEAKFKQMQM